MWDSSPDSGKGSPPTVAPKVLPRTHSRSRAGQKSRFFRESSVLPTPQAGASQLCSLQPLLSQHSCTAMRHQQPCIQITDVPAAE